MKPVVICVTGLSSKLAPAMGVSRRSTLIQRERLVQFYQSRVAVSQAQRGDGRGADDDTLEQINGHAQVIGHDEFNHVSMRNRYDQPLVFGVRAGDLFDGHPTLVKLNETFP